MFRICLFVVSCLFLFSSCAESLEDQVIANVEDNRVFQVDLEDRRYGFGYINSTENDPDRPNLNRFRESIALTTADVSDDGGLLSGTSQVIAIELEFSRSLGQEELNIDLGLLNQGGLVTFANVFLAEDFDFDTREARQRRGLRSGVLTIKKFSNGARKITLNSQTGGIDLAGSWAGYLEDAQVVF